MTMQQLSNYYNDLQTKWLGGKPDFDGWYGSQCVDLVQFYNKALGGSPFTGDYAYQIKGQTQNIYTWIENDETAKAQKGDIAVWTQGYNGWAGHTAVANGQGEVNGNDNDWFEALSVNDPTGSACIVKRYSYDFVSGFLRPKVVGAPVTPTPTPTPTPTIPSNIQTKASFFDLYWHAMYGDAVDTDKVTKAQVEARIREAKSEKYRSGEWDKLAKLANYTGDTSVLTASSMKDLILALSKPNRQPQIDEIKKKIKNYLDSV